MSEGRIFDLSCGIFEVRRIFMARRARRAGIQALASFLKTWQGAMFGFRSSSSQSKPLEDRLSCTARMRWLADRDFVSTPAETCELIRQHKNEPFFLAVGFVRPHVPFVAPKSYFNPYPFDEVILPEKVEGDWEDIPERGINYVNSVNAEMNPDQERKAVAGGYSNKSRGMRKKAGTNDVAPSIAPGELTSKQFRRRWAMLIQKIYEVDPLCCPNCRKQMRIISILEAAPIVRKILEHLDLWDTRNHDPPDEEDSHMAELVYDDSVSQIPQYDYWD